MVDAGWRQVVAAEDDDALNFERLADLLDNPETAILVIKALFGDSLTALSAFDAPSDPRYQYQTRPLAPSVIADDKIDAALTHLGKREKD